MNAADPISPAAGRVPGSASLWLVGRRILRRRTSDAIESAFPGAPHRRTTRESAFRQDAETSRPEARATRRPQNWAFLAGDRTAQPSSRDHLDPSKRWFPPEREAFLPLIEAKEKEIDALAAQLAQPAK